FQLIEAYLDACPETKEVGVKEDSLNTKKGSSSTSREPSEPVRAPHPLANVIWLKDQRFGHLMEMPDAFSLLHQKPVVAARHLPAVLIIGLVVAPFATAHGARAVCDRVCRHVVHEPPHRGAVVGP
nr:hypothetical protein [Tanacetum cinerariifolium]